MKRFDCTALDCPLFGPHLLEASAGTGKTFSIEHVFVRLILESVELEQILTVTFTRAAARELKARIRSNLNSAISFLESPSIHRGIEELEIGQEGSPDFLAGARGIAASQDPKRGRKIWGKADASLGVPADASSVGQGVGQNQFFSHDVYKSSWEYLKPFVNNREALRRLCETARIFDRCQIFTIHSFCHRMLREFAFEANLQFSLPDPDGENRISKQRKRAVRSFLETLTEDLICPEQMAHLLKKFDSVSELEKDLLKSDRRKKGAPFSELSKRYLQIAQEWGEPWPKKEELLHAFEQLLPMCKKMEGNFQAQVLALAEPSETSFRTLIWEKGSLFDLLSLENRKKKAALSDPHPFFEKASRSFGPLIQEALDCKALFFQQEHTNPDEILFQMKEAMAQESFLEKVRTKYTALIIDEFQDTDPLQWEIFQKLFSSLRALYLVGDPKQSIYRFRNADVYTYLQARETLGKEAHYFLDTNFRSSKKLLGALNALFHQSPFPLPKANCAIPYTPVKAGSSIESTFQDGKGAVHAALAKEEKEFLPFAIAEIERLLPELESPGAFALLVKDRYQAETALQALREREIPAFAKSHTPLGKTETFQAIRELFEAILFPRDPVRSRIVQIGPLADIPLPTQQILKEEGLTPLLNRIQCVDGLCESDLQQLIEELLAWEQKEGFSTSGLLQFFRELEQMDSDEGGRRRLETDENAVQIVTLHSSKGLEFDVVFAWGLASSSSAKEEDPEESDAEKLRQLYVAMTRAKKRLYFPVIPSSKNRSPMDLFLYSKGPLLPYFQSLAEKESFTFEEIPAPFSLPPPTRQKKTPPPKTTLQPVPYRPYFLHSFTSLAQEKKRLLSSQEIPSEPTIHSLPRGAETGVAIHQIFERIFSEKIDYRAIVAEEMQFSPLKPWQKAIEQMVEETLSLPLLENFALKDLDSQSVVTEMEFVFEAPPHFIKGFIDLVFLWKGKYYFLDWKTNWLGSSDADYHPQALEQAMEEHDYKLQASLYAEALKRYIKNFPELFGGAFYLFVRGKAAHHFQPKLDPLNGLQPLFR